MNAAAPWTRVLLAPWQQRRNRGAVWPFLVLVGLMCALPLAGAAFAQTVAMNVFALAVLSVPLFGGWIWLVLSLLQQNHPNAARLVPGHVRTLRLVLLGAWLVPTVLAAIVGSTFGRPWGPAAGVGMGLLLLVLMWLVRLPLLGLVFWIVPATSARWAPLGALLWTDWARVKAPTAMSSVAPLMVVMPLALGAIAAQAWMGVPAWVCVLCFVVAAVLLIAWRARRLADAPSAFPAGRFG